jgi:transcriptional regulator with XRE-family HTH domain
MQLSAYLKQQGLTEAAFAELIGSTQQTVNRICRGTVPRRETLERIVVATKGAVGWEDFNPLTRTGRWRHTRDVSAA